MKIKSTYLVLFLLLNFVSVFAQNPDVTYEQVALTDIGTISIPSIMELQSGIRKDLSNSLGKELGIDFSGSIIYQQKGLNSSFKKSSTYARLMISESRGKAGEFRTINSKLSLTAKQLKVLDDNSKVEIETQFLNSNTGLKLIKWFGTSLEKLNGNSLVRTSYIRQLKDNPPVYVEMYYIENYDRTYLFTLSYRLEDSSIWADVFARVKESFKVTNIIMPIKKKSKAKNR